MLDRDDPIGAMKLYDHLARPFACADELDIAWMNEHWKLVDETEDDVGSALHSVLMERASPRAALLSSVCWFDASAVIRSVPEGDYIAYFRICFRSRPSLFNQVFRVEVGVTIDVPRPRREPSGGAAAGDGEEGGVVGEGNGQAVANGAAMGVEAEWDGFAADDDEDGEVSDDDSGHGGGAGAREVSSYIETLVRELNLSPWVAAPGDVPLNRWLTLELPPVHVGPRGRWRRRRQQQGRGGGFVDVKLWLRDHSNQWKRGVVLDVVGLEKASPAEVRRRQLEVRNTTRAPNGEVATDGLRVASGLVGRGALFWASVAVVVAWLVAHFGGFSAF
ncbi:hypothetical protein DFJ73DRAFT_182820 [Zopfochytrium polystomum]|nr:hypothetical protein DFJ73DRAFT_182820 [Zopfochytrium polystomum]